MSRPPLRVVKVGGSLFDWPLLPTKLSEWLDCQPAMATVFIAGGGRLADLVRQADRDFQLGEETAHDLCVELLSVSARLLACLLPKAQLVRDFLTVQSAARLAAAPIDIETPFVIDPRAFLVTFEPKFPGDRLPHNWQVTTDSIAARLSFCLSAAELVLLKSTLPAGETTRQQAAETGCVDEYFPRAASEIAKVKIVNLRQPGFPAGELAR